MMKRQLVGMDCVVTADGKRSDLEYMKLSQAILMLNKLRKKHGDVEVLVKDDNNGQEIEFYGGFVPPKIVTTGDGEKHTTGGYVLIG